MSKYNYVKVEKIEECGYKTAILGLSMNKKQSVEDMPRVAKKLCNLGNGHNKFLRQMYLSFKITAPAYWWGEFDTYKIGTVAQSTSIMHTFEKELMNVDLKDFDSVNTFLTENFEINSGVNKDTLWELSQMIKTNICALRAKIPSGYLYTRVISMNYEILRTMINQRWNHRLPHWRSCLTQMIKQIEYKEFINQNIEKKE